MFWFGVAVVTFVIVGSLCFFMIGPSTGPPKSSLLSFGSSSSDSFPSSSVSILVWNLEKGKEKMFRHDFSLLFSEKTVDLLLAQEFVDSLELPRLNETAYHMGVAFEYLKTGVNAGTLTGSKTRPSSVHVEISADAEPIVNTKKSALITTFAVGQQELLVVNIHGRNRGGLEPFVAQLTSLGQYVKNHTGPVVFAGDFNTNSKEKMTFLDQFMAKLELKEVQFENDARTKSKLSRQYLDHIYVSKEIQVVKSKVFGADEITGSDHQPMLVTLKI